MLERPFAYTYERYQASHCKYNTNQARREAMKHMNGYEDIPRFKDPATNELLKKHGKRWWCKVSYEQRIVQWLLRNGLSKKSVRAIARAAHTSEGYCLELHNRYAWEAYAKKESDRL
jgi:hypothetical protein